MTAQRIPRMTVRQFRMPLFTEVEIEWNGKKFWTTEPPGRVPRRRIDQLKRRFAHIPEPKKEDAAR